MTTLEEEVYSNDQQTFAEIRELINQAQTIVVLAGAGLSAESGIPTYRGNEGIWNKYNPMELATAEAFEKDPKLIWEWYNWKREFMKAAEPNAAYHALKKLQDLKGDGFTLITQNIDGLHTRAGITNAIEIHGSIWRLRPHGKNLYRQSGMGCPSWPGEPPKYNEYNYELNLPTPPYCANEETHVEWALRPDVVWFGESLDVDLLNKAIESTVEADLLFIIGTSAVVAPVCNFPIFRAVYNHNDGKTIFINTEETDHINFSNYILIGKAGYFLSEITEEL